MGSYEGVTMIKSFRGMIVDGGQDTIPLRTNDGSTGYRIVRFEIVTTAPGTASSENVVKIFKVLQSTVDATIDMTNNKLLGAAIYHENTAIYVIHTIFFESEVFNQDIYVTNSDAGAAGSSCNYYIELEQIKLDLGESTVATLKDIRNLEYPPAGG